MPAKSSVIASYGYDEETAELTITFRSGRRYRYFDVPDWVADELATAPSTGEYFNGCIRDRYRFAELDPP